MAEIRKYLVAFNGLKKWGIDLIRREAQKQGEYILKFSTREFFERDGMTRIEYKIVSTDVADKLLEKEKGMII